MRLRELIVLEDGEGGATAGATTSANIATVAYPLFVRGATRKQKRKNARAAVGQRYVPGPAYIGQGVFEGVAEGSLNEFASSGSDENEYIRGYRDGHGYPEIVKTSKNKEIYMMVTPKNPPLTDRYLQGWNHAKYGPPGRNDLIDLSKLKEQDVEEQGYGNHPSQRVDPRTGKQYVPPKSPLGQGVAEGSLEDRLKKYVRPTVKTTPKIERTTNPAGRTTDHVEWKVTGPMGDVSRFTSKKAAQAHYDSFGMSEAHVLNHDNVIYRLDKENPMSDTEVLVLGGAGRYSLKGLRDKARREAAALAQDLSIEHGGAFRRSAENIKQLTNTINTIVAAYNELARLRRRGGRGSRGITDEDTNFIRECIRVVEQATQNYRLMEGAYKQIGDTHSQPQIHKGRKK